MKQICEPAPESTHEIVSWPFPEQLTWTAMRTQVSPPNCSVPRVFDQPLPIQFMKGQSREGLVTPLLNILLETCPGGDAE